MAITEHARHEMIEALQRTIGKDAAMTLAEHLPPTGWSDVVRRSDLDALEQRLEHRFEVIDHRFEVMEHRFETTLYRTLNRWMLANSALVLSAIAVTATLT